jgi:transcriptional antiterminator NusG
LSESEFENTESIFPPEIDPEEMPASEEEGHMNAPEDVAMEEASVEETPEAVDQGEVDEVEQEASDVQELEAIEEEANLEVPEVVELKQPEPEDQPVGIVADEEVMSEEGDVDAEARVEVEEKPPVEQDESGRLWYVVHCYSGYENKVRHNLEQRIETMGMKGKIFDVVVPTEEEIEIKDGKRRTVERRVFPGYILVQMIMDEDSWYVVRNTPGVTGFVGMGNDPTPLRPEEVVQIVKRMEAEAPRIKVTYKQGQKVRIIDGPFNDFIGTVSDIDMERAKVRVMVSFFGRETPVELDFLQVEKA